MQPRSLRSRHEGPSHAWSVRAPRVRRLALTVAVACAAGSTALLGAASGPVAVRIDGSRMAINGEPVFPLAIYVANNPRRLLDNPGAMEAVLGDLADSPFHILINYAGPESPPAAQRRYLDALRKHGLYEIFSIKDYYAEGVWGASPFLRGRSEQRAISEDVKSLADHPAVLGWYLSDEETDAAAVRRHHEWVGAADPSRFTLTLVNRPDAEWIAGFLDCGDVLAIDAYPIGNGGRITDVATYADALAAATDAQRPAWFVVQAYGGYMYRQDFRDTPGARVPLDAMRTRGRAPTPREMRAMTFLALTHGATGLVFYYYKDIMMSFDREQRWAAVKAIGRDVERLTPILLAEDIDPGHMSCDNEHVHWRLKASPAGVALMAVNGLSTTESAKFTFPVVPTGASVRSGAAFAHTEGKELLLILDGYEAVVVDVATGDSFGREAPATPKPDAVPEVARTIGGGHWGFEEDAGPGVVDTMGPTREDGVLTGTLARAEQVPPASALPATVQSRRSLELSGDPASSLIMGAVDELDVGIRDFTLEAWIRPRAGATNCVVAGKGISGYFEEKGFELRIANTGGADGSAYLVQFGATSLDRPLRSAQLPYGVWQHVAVTRARRTVRMYVAGRAVDEAPLAPPGDLGSRQRFAIGCIALQGKGVSGNQFDGHIDEVRLVIGEALAPNAFLCRVAAGRRP